MDRSKNKSFRQYDYISRYTKFPYYYQELDGKNFYGITQNIKKNISYTVHKLRDYDTLDLLALTYYGRPDFYWFIADYNDIKNPFIRLKDKFDSIRIPSLSEVSFGGER